MRHRLSNIKVNGAVFVVVVVDELITIKIEDTAAKAAAHIVCASGEKHTSVVVGIYIVAAWW